jgi:hypothetical protein
MSAMRPEDGLLAPNAPISREQRLIDGLKEENERLKERLKVAEKNEGRWNHARQFLAVEDIDQWAAEDWVGHHPDELESKATDDAIDAAIAAIKGSECG